MTFTCSSEMISCAFLFTASFVSHCACFIKRACLPRGLPPRQRIRACMEHACIACMQVGVPKTESLKDACAALNSTVVIEQHRTRLLPDNAVTLCAAYDVVADCSDNPSTRYLVNDACVATGKPLVSGAAVGTDGQLSVYGYQGGPCYRCACSACMTEPPKFEPI
jgi:hypothetical protein